MSEEQVESLMNQAEDLEKRKEYDRAIAILEQARAIGPKNVEVLRQYGKILAKRERYEDALEVFEQPLKIEPEHVDALRNYGTALADKGLYDRAFEMFEWALQVDPKNPKTIASYGNALASAGRYEQAFEMFERVLQVEPNDAITLASYGTALASVGRYEQAFELFERELQVEPNNAKTLGSYGNTLASAGRYEQALKMFDRALKVIPEDESTLKNYANTLTLAGYYEKALEVFKRVIEKVVEPKNAIILTGYATALTAAGRYDLALEVFEKLLEIEPENDRIIIMYGNALEKFKNYEKAREMYKRAIMLAPDNTLALKIYGMLLVKTSKWEDACTVFRQFLQIKSDAYILFQYARALEELSQYSEAISELKAIAVDKLPQEHANVILLTIGRLYYLIKQPDKGNEYFEQAIANSDDKEQKRLYSARSILASDPYSQTAVEMVRKITEESWRYTQAQAMLTLNLSEEDYLKMVKADAQSGLNDTEVLNRAMYHKIANEISLLKGMVYRILRVTKSESPLLNEIIQNIEYMFEKVHQLRTSQKSQVEIIPHNDYSKILAIIVKTARDISDVVNNELAVIESQIRRAMRKLQPSEAHQNLFNKLLTVLEQTQTILSDLKAINEGINIKSNRFQVKKLFEQWEAKFTIDRAKVVLDIQNGNSEFYGDEEKIKGILNELLENSLNHNHDLPEFTIWMTSRDAINPQGIRGMTIPQKYLFIEFADNGKGILEDKKDWIFQPLKTTSDRGSGLGLFIIRKTLAMMKGYIRETGQNGARFEIYIPYRKGEM